MKIVLINGKKRAGKDYLAEELKKEMEKNGKKSEIINFADPIKDILCMALNISLEEFNEGKNLNYPISINGKKYTDCRKLIQVFGTEAMRKYFGEYVWVNIMKSEIEKMDKDVEFVFIPDYRFLIESISDLTINIYNNYVTCSDDHRSENELNAVKFKYYIDNLNNRDISKEITQLTNDLINY